MQNDPGQVAMTFSKRAARDTDFEEPSQEQEHAHTDSNSRSRPLALKPLHPKTALGHRVQEERGPKVIENAKTALFLRGHGCSEVVHQVMQDLASLKKPEAIFFSRRRELHPFELNTSAETLSFLSRKNDASFLVVGNNSKKRPHNMCIARMFDHRVLDMVEFEIVGFRSIFGIGGTTLGLGLRPAMIFQGELFELQREYKMVQNLFLDFFHGEHVDSLHLAGLEGVIVVTALPGRILFRVYRVTGSGAANLQLIGPALDLKLGRAHFPADDLMRQACKIPRELLPKKVKNITRDAIGDQFGRVHVGDQKLQQIQTRKVKALKRNRDDELGINADSAE